MTTEKLEEEIQGRLRGIWRSRMGCPHYHGREDIGVCDANELRSCLYDTGETCHLFREILAEWEKEFLD